MTDHDSERNNIPKHLHLSDKQREFLKQESSPDDPGKLLRTILNLKVKNLPARIRRLLTDINLLAEAGFFNSSWNAELFDRVHTNKDWIQSYDWSEHFYRTFPGYEEELNETEKAILRSILIADADGEKIVHAQRFGAELGEAFCSLTESHLSNEEKEYLVFGFLLKILTEEADADIDDSYVKLQESLKNFDKMADNWHLMSSFNKNVTKQSENYVREHIEIINSVIREADLKNSNILSQLVMEMSYDLEEESITQINPFDNEWVLKNTELYSNKDTSIGEFRKQKRKTAEEVIQIIEEKTDISEVGELIEALRHVFIFIHQYDELWRVFKQISGEHIASSSDNLFNNPSELFDDQQGDKMSCIRTLSNEKCYVVGNKERWIEFPLITEDSYTSHWKFTPLGELVIDILIKKDDPRLAIEMVHGYALNVGLSEEERDLLRRALEQVGGM